MLMETAVLQRKNYEVYLKWAKWLMIMGYVYSILDFLFWKFVNWGWILSDYYNWEIVELVRPYSYLVFAMLYLSFILSCFVLRKYPNVVYRTFATRLIIALILALIYNTINIIYYIIYSEALVIALFSKILIEFIISAFFIWAYSTLMDDDKKQFVAIISICVFLVMTLFVVYLFVFERSYDERVRGSAGLIWGWTKFFISIVYIILWKSLLATPTNISFNLELKSPACINRVLVGYIIVSFVFIFCSYVLYYCWLGLLES